MQPVGNCTWAPPAWTRSAAALAANVGHGATCFLPEKTSRAAAFSTDWSRLSWLSGSPANVADAWRVIRWATAEPASSKIGGCSESGGGQRSSWTRFCKRASSWRRRRPGRSRDHGPMTQAEWNRGILGPVFVESDANVCSTRTREPRSYCRNSAGAGYSASTILPCRHRQIPASGAAMLLMDGRTLYLRVVSVQMWAELVFVDQPQQVRRIQHVQDGSKNRSLWTPHKRKVTVEDALPPRTAIQQR